MLEIFDDDIINNYNGWEIAENGKFLYNNAIEYQPTLIYNTENKDISELSYPKNIDSGYQYVLFTSNYIIYNNKDCIIIEDYSNKIIRIINNHGSLITYMTKNNKYLFFADNDNNVKIYCLDTFQSLYFMYSYNTNIISISHDNKYYVNSGAKLDIYNLETMEHIITINPKKYILLTAICYKHIATFRQNIIIYSIYGTELFELEEHEEKVHYLDYSYDNCYLYCGTKSELIIYETDNYNIVKKYDLEDISSYYLTNDDYKILYVNEKELEYIYTPKFHQFIHNLLIDYLPYELVRNILCFL